MTTLPLIVIVGPTASGKTGLAIKLAQRFDGEIVSADSRAVYDGLDIGAAKPDLAERAGINHWGFDLVKPGEKFSAADFKDYANTKIKEIRSRNHVPFLVGGSGLYVDSVMFDFDFPKKVSDSCREKYNDMSIEELISYCKNNNIDLPENWQNKRYVINQIVRNGTKPKRRIEPIDHCLIFGIRTDREVLRYRINQRVEQMFARGVIEEATNVASAYGWENEALTGDIYRTIHQYLSKTISYEKMVTLTQIADWHLAKRQLTWFKRNQFIEWLDLAEAEQKIAQKIRDVLEY